MILSHILLFTLAAVLIVLVPGPNMTFLITCAANYGRRTAILALLGSNAALLTLGILTGLGLSSLLMAVPLVYDGLKIAGAFYFFWLAFKSIFLKVNSLDENQVSSVYSDPVAFRNGYLTNILNPKAAVFYVAIFPQFLIPGLGYMVLQGTALSLVHAAVSFTINSIIIISVNHMSARFKESRKVHLLKKWGTAIIFTAFGIRMLMQKNN
jgi:threonine/homoserine/homoserine lactone efflux protein